MDMNGGFCSGFIFLQFFNDFLCFHFGWMCDGASRANIFASSTHDYACILVLNNRFLFPFFLFKSKSVHVTEINTFSAADTFFIINFGAPWNFASWNAFIFFFSHACRLFLEVRGPGRGFEPRQKAPQASRLPSYLTPATFQWPMPLFVLG